VACVGLTDEERLVTAEAQTPGNELLIVGNATGRDGLGGASFASEDLEEDAETEDRPAVQVGDPYAEKRLIEANEELVEAGLVRSARDLGAAGLGGASSELVAKGGLGARIDLGAVHQREPEMNALEILLAESQERMCYEVRPGDVEAVREVTEKYDLGCSAIGEVTAGNYVCEFEGETVVDCAAEFLAEGAPMNDLERVAPGQPGRDLPDVGLEAALAVREAGDGETGIGLAFSSGADPNWTAAAPYDGARAVALENATNVAATGATPLAAVDCLNGGNPEKPDVYGGFAAIVDGLADMCSELSVPVVGGNVSLYNDSPSGPIPPTPTLAMTGTKPGYEAPTAALDGDGTLLVVGGADGADARRLGGSELLARFGGTDRFPAVPDDAAALVEAIADVAGADSTLSTHDVSHGGLAVTLAEMVGPAGADVELAPDPSALEALFSEGVGRVVVETTDPATVRERLDGVAPVTRLGEAIDDGRLECAVGGTELTYTAGEVAALRDTIESAL
ncbi:phosphoribosylformylglycinamidine synthase II, partial [Halobacteriales archaeon QH_10_70_21]